MRRVVSTILFVIGGWLLTSEAMMAWVDMGLGAGGQLLALSFILAFAIIPLALGTLISPGNRRANLGMTLMIVAVVTAVCGITVLLALNDPAVARMMPPGQPLPDLAIDPVYGGTNLLLIAGLGYLLWRTGRAHFKSRQAELERVFDD